MLPFVAFVSDSHAQAGSAESGREHAKMLFDEGTSLEKKTDYSAALAKYIEAEQFAITPGLRFHKGYCFEMTGKLATAVEEYDAADRLARELNKQDVHSAILVRLDPLRVRVPLLAIRLVTSASNSDVSIEFDGAPIALSVPNVLSAKPFRVDPGEHTVTVRAVGYQSVTRTLQAPESVTTTVDMNLDREVIAVAAGAPSESPSVPVLLPSASTTHLPSRALSWGTTAGAIAFAGVGAAFFFAADGAQSSALRNCPTRTHCDDERSRIRTLDAFALGSFLGAAGLGIASFAMWRTKPSSHAAVSLSPLFPLACAGVF